MRDSRPQSIEKLFDETQSSGTLQQIQQRAVALNKLNKAVRALLPSQLHPWLRVANYRQGILVLEVANASWMMRLRYEQPALLSALRAQIIPSLAAIDISINPSLAAKTAPTSQHSAPAAASKENNMGCQLSAESAAALRNVAARSPEKLKEKLERLASLAGESGTSKTSRDK
ncbi:hypothetical protein BL250_10085 [Erwinia sp. OLTSP20]|uniref:DUF721 domain-containing protein n=1 Tax=unclassified Erwinia TaxID=2622719 RepID=UPI000C18ACF6|nr:MULTISPECIES: DciA family protein [unclassified Erwinia]PIJ49756.1 hypothetical protein BV501_11215 [Erwinia sp. OAMSP11]PIJ70855.1 hypothetical protein BK416_12405 [Erwinia sp. OLSSP12]PIJ80220.1 hypothetical protein BLD47_11270 [Erwinia sp. OLCASP19]PIJ82344.1 hypothetical protein BLD46_11020 [Erwinia sp. OLMTSP26]PIJ85030.1 hypothetical protein BLD49_11130 [Erwinia sp. OLMDSP33]